MILMIAGVTIAAVTMAAIRAKVGKGFHHEEFWQNQEMICSIGTS